jgi:hypothetical protein
MRGLTVFSIIAVLSTLLGTSVAPVVRPARAQVTVGATVSVLAPGVDVSTQGAPFVGSTNGQTVGAGDQVRTGPTGVALLTFFDGSETQLTSNSLVQIESPPGGGLVSVFQAVGTV